MKSLPLSALLMGYGGLIPFVMLSWAVITGKGVLGFDQAETIGLLETYAIVIISFIGAVHWGYALANHKELSASQSCQFYYYSVVPALAAWFTLFLSSHRLILIVLGVLVILLYLIDRVLLIPKLTINYGKLRLHLTIVVSVCLLSAGFFGV